MNPSEIPLQRCRELAAQAAQTGNAPVGAVVIRRGIMVGEGREATRPTGDITRHAEGEAIRDAVRQTGSTDLSDCSLYTTHEPCILCSYVIRHHRIGAVVFEATVPAVGGASSPYPILLADDVPGWAPPPGVWVGDGQLPLSFRAFTR